jgi:transposase
LNLGLNTEAIEFFSSTAPRRGGRGAGPELAAKRIDHKLAEFALAGSIAEQEARRVLKSIPGVAAVTTDVVLSEIGDIRRFSSQRKATAFAGLAPGIRESAGRAKHRASPKKAPASCGGHSCRPRGGW